MKRQASLLGILLLSGALAVTLASCSDEDEVPPGPVGGQAGAGGDGGEAGSGAVGGAGGAGGVAEPFELDPQRAHDDMAWLADPAREGRAPGTAGNEAALDYVEALFDELGLTPAGDDDTYRQAFGFDYWSVLGPPVVEVDGAQLVAGTDYRILSYSGSSAVTGEIVFAGYGLTVPAFDPGQYPQCPLDPAGYDDYAGIDVTDQIAVVLRHGPNDDQDIYDHCPANQACAAPPCLWNFGYKSTNAALHGAAAVIVVQDYQHPGDDVLSATLDGAYYDPDIAAVFMDRGVIEASVSELQTWADAIDASVQPAGQATGVTATVTLDAALEPIVTENLLGMVEGTDPELSDEVVVIGAHIDHLGIDGATNELFPGADDNASGTATMMELARALVLGDVQSARTVLFASWNAEELGLIGSCYYVDHPTLPIANTVVAFSVDMVGVGNESGLVLSGGGSGDHPWVTAVMQGSAAAHGLDYQVIPGQQIYASDHACFDVAGAPGLMVATAGTHGTYHTPEDDVDNVTVGNMEVAVRTMWATLETLATGSEASYVTSAPVSSPPGPTLAQHPWIRDR